MAHKLEQRDNSTSFAYTKRELPWHGLGQAVDGAMTAEQAIKLARLDYPVMKVQNTVTRVDLEGKAIYKDGFPIFDTAPSFTTLRADTGAHLGTVGDDYTVIQNIEAFTFFDSIVERGDAIYETAGVLGNGELAFISAKLPGHISVGTDIVEPYVLLVMSHDGTRAIQAQYTPVRVVCNNTLNAAMRNRDEVRTIRHTKNAQARLEQAASTMGMVNQLTRELEQAFNSMKDQRVLDSQLIDHIGKVMLSKEQRAKLNEGTEIATRAKNVLDSVKDYYFAGAGQDMPGVIGTGWGLYNAITGYYANVKTFDDESHRFKSNLLNGNHAVMGKAFEYCLNLK